MKYTKEIQDLINDYKELLQSWNGESLVTEEKINELAGELEELGVNLDDLED